LLIIGINILTTLITISLTLYNVNWNLIDSFWLFIHGMVQGFLINFRTFSFFLFLFIAWIIKILILYFLSNEEKKFLRKKHSILGGIPFFGFGYGIHLKIKQNNIKSIT
jgi:hypothetical protein